MEPIILSTCVAIVGILIMVAFVIISCNMCQREKQPIAQSPEEGIPEGGRSSFGASGTGGEKEAASTSGSSPAPTPSPVRYPGKRRSSSVRPKRIPKAGHTCPVKPADEDPTMPVEDDLMAYKMAAGNRPATPIPKLSAVR